MENDLLPKKQGMLQLVKKRSSQFLRRKAKQQEEELARSSTDIPPVPPLPKHDREPRNSLESIWVGLEEAEDITQANSLIPKERDGLQYQPFKRSESPWSVGRHGLYELGEPTEIPPPLPQAPEGIVFGKTVPVELPDEPLLQPGELVPLVDFLREPPPEPAKKPNLIEKIGRKRQQAKALTEPPKVDPEFAMLLKGVNNRRDPDKGPLTPKERQQKLDQLPLPPVSQQRKPKSLPQMPLARPAKPPPPPDRPASPRYCPAILPTKHFEPEPARNEWDTPFEGNYAPVIETEEERAERLHVTTKARDQRIASDRYLRLQGQRQINDHSIGRPPPLSERILSQPLRLTSTGEKILKQQTLEMVKETGKEKKREKQKQAAAATAVEARNLARQSQALQVRPLHDFPNTTYRIQTSGSVAAQLELLKNQATWNFSATPETYLPIPAGSQGPRWIEYSTRKVSEPTSSTTLPKQTGPPKQFARNKSSASDGQYGAVRPGNPGYGLPLGVPNRLRGYSCARPTPLRTVITHPTPAVPGANTSRMRRATEPSTQTAAAVGSAQLANPQEQPSAFSVPSSDVSLKGKDNGTSKSIEPKENAVTDLLDPKKGGRYHQWDQALRANKKPPVILQTPPLPDRSPPLVPGTSLWIPPDQLDKSPVQAITENPFNISGIPTQLRPSKRLGPDWKNAIESPYSQLKPKQSSECNSNHSADLLEEDGSGFFAVEQALAKSSEGLTHVCTSEGDQTEDTTRLADSEFPSISQGGSSPFDDADDERRRAWDNAQKSLTSKDRERLHESFNLEKLAALLPHLVLEQQDTSPDLPDTHIVGGDEAQRFACETGETPRTRDGQVIGQAISNYSPSHPHNKQTSKQTLASAHRRNGIGHRRVQPQLIDTGVIARSRDQPQIHHGEESKRKVLARPLPEPHALVQGGEDQKDAKVSLQLATKTPLRVAEAYRRGPIGTSGFMLYSPYSPYSPFIQPPQPLQFTRAQTIMQATVPPTTVFTPPTTVPTTQDAAIVEQYRPPRLFSLLHENRPPPRPLPPLPVRPQPQPQQPLEPVPEPVPPKLKTKKSLVSFLGVSLPVSESRPAKMESRLQVRPSEFSSVKAKAVEDARQMQATVIEVANKAGKDPPKYALLELIGKGSFGRVYKGKDMTSAAIVAVKIIDIDESDTLNPRLADSYSEFLKEVNALKILSESNARNINHVIEALPVGQSMWMVTEHCGGGSIATLMKPTAPGGLQEKWIIPILREVAEAIKWVHQAGIIHRDIKCANVLITEQGGVQLCDFGVAGIIENKLDKRSTVIGTPHWMAPELFDATPSYGKEVDIWAFGSMVFEIATGLPPNAANGIPFDRLGPHLKQHVPRLEGGNYSNELRNLVAFCLEELPSARPTIEQVQRHPYIYNTASKYPASSLSSLVRAFKMWEDHGGSRKSLFMLGGAQGPSEVSSSVSDDEWNFSTTAAFDQEVLRKSTPADVFDAYGNGVALDDFFTEETSRPQKPSRRRPPPEALARLPAPLEKIFDPNTMSNYEDNSRSHYGRVMQQPASDLPLRDDTAQTSIRDTMIDLGGHDSDTGLSNFPDMDTIKANRRGTREEVEEEYTSTLHDFSRPALSDPADINPNRRTQDWKFPTMAPPASADPEFSRFPNTYDLPRPTVTPGSSGPGGRPALVHHPTEPVGTSFAGSLLHAQQPVLDRLSMRDSLIDLDMSMPDTISSFVPHFAPSTTRPSTANSDTGSATSEHMASGNPFELERHASLYAPLSAESTGITEPEYYLNEESAVPLRLRSSSTIRDINEISDFSASDAESCQDPSIDGKYDTYSDSDMPPPPLPAQAPFPRPVNQPYTFNHFPELPAPPSEKALSGLATHDEMKDEFNRMLSSMTSQLEAFRDVYSAPQVVSRKVPTPQRRERKDGGAGGVMNGASNGG